MRKRIFLLGFAFLVFSCGKDQKVAISSESINVYFSPNGGALSAIVREIDGAKGTLDIAMFSFTSREIGDAVLRATQRGVKVRIILDQGQAKERFSRYPLFLQANIPVKLLPGGEKKFVKGLMHNKFAVIDGKEVITGSYNWTASAEKLNYENLLIIRSPDLAKKYEDYFEKMWER